MQTKSLCFGLDSSHKFNLWTFTLAYPTYDNIKLAFMFYIWIPNLVVLLSICKLLFNNRTCYLSMVIHFFYFIALCGAVRKYHSYLLNEAYNITMNLLNFFFPLKLSSIGIKIKVNNIHVVLHLFKTNTTPPHHIHGLYSLFWIYWILLYMCQNKITLGSNLHIPK